MAYTQYYLDPDSGSDSNDGTSDAQAWLTMQKFIDEVDTTRDTTDGDVLNIKDSATLTLTANLTWTAFTWNTDYPLLMRGYTSTAGDGGRVSLDLNGYRFLMSGGDTNMLFQGWDITNTGSNVNQPFQTGGNISWINCNLSDIDTGTSNGYVIYNNSTAGTFNVIGCSFTDIKGNPVCNNSYAANILGNHFYASGSKSFNHCVYNLGSKYMHFANNIINVDSTTDGIGGNSAQLGHQIYGNTFFTSGTGTAIYQNYKGDGWSIENNILEGWDKAIDFNKLSTGIVHSLRNNHFYDNTTDIDTHAEQIFMIQEGNFEAAGASVLAKSGANTHANRFVYFAPTGDAVGGASYGNLDIGAVPAICSDGGGLIRSAGMTGGMN